MTSVAAHDGTSLDNSIQSVNQPRSYFGLVAGILVLLIYACNHSLHRKDSIGFPCIPGLPVIGSLSFFTRRHHFIHESLAQLGDVFSFNVLRHKILLVSGIEARKAFFGHKDLSPFEGYKILLGASPKIEDIKVGNVSDTDDSMKFPKQLLFILRSDQLEKTLPALLKDLDRCMTKWGNNGQFNPFDDVYNMTFQLTCRMLSCREIADDPSLVARVAKLYWEIENGATPTAVLLPWFPSPARKLKEKATTDLYLLLKGILDKRIQEGRREEDAAQALLDAGDSVDDTIKFNFSALFAGIASTGMMASWLPLYLAANPEWKEKVLTQTRSFIDKHAPAHGSLSERLAHLTPKVWEEGMSVIDACLRETMRITLTGTFIRRILPSGEGENAVMFKGKKISEGSFVAYPVTETHLNPDIYPNPEVWDPSRYERGEDRKEYWAYLGWGVGRHPCLGMRFAKVEVKLIVTLLLMQYDYKLVDSAGEPVLELPGPDRHNTYKQPPLKPVYIQYNRVES